MSNIGLVTATSIKNNFRVKTVWIIMVPINLICVVGVAVLLCVLLIAPETKSAAPDRAVLEGYLGLVLYASSVFALGISLNSMVFPTIVKEKSRGNLTALLATPLRVSDIWLGKSLGLFMPGLVMGIALTVISWVIVNLVYFLPDIGWIINPQMVINSLIAVPLIYLFFGLFVHLVGFIARPATGNIIAQVFLPVMANIVAQLVIRGVMDANSWQFMVMNFGIAIVFGGIVLIIRSRLIPEKIILTS